MKILITAANSAEAHRLRNKLGLENIILGDYLDLPAFMIIAASIVILPNPSSTSYTHEMLSLCLDKHIHTIYALREQERIALNTASQLFKEYDIVIVSST